MMRLGACIQAMKKAIAEGEIGKMVSAYAQFTCWYPDIPGTWRQKKTQGGYDAQQDHAATSGSRARRMLVFYVLICWGVSENSQRTRTAGLFMLRCAIFPWNTSVFLRKNVLLNAKIPRCRSHWELEEYTLD